MKKINNKSKIKKIKVKRNNAKILKIKKTLMRIIINFLLKEIISQKNFMNIKMQLKYSTIMNLTLKLILLKKS